VVNFGISYVLQHLWQFDVILRILNVFIETTLTLLPACHQG